MAIVGYRPRTQAERLNALRPLLPRFRERLRQYDERAEFPSANFDDLRAAGLLTLTIPREDGGDGLWQGTRFADFYEILETIAAADSSTAQMLQVHSHASGVLAAHATPRQRETYVADIVANGKLVASVGSEADPAKMAAELWVSELTATPAGWRLTCKKHFASLGPGADYFLVWVAVPGTGRYAERQVPIVVPREAPEVELINEWDTLGMRSTVSWALKVTDYAVPEDAIVGEPGTWVRSDPRSFTLAYAANHLGTAQGAFDFIRDWVKQRADLARSEYLRVVLGDMASALFGARSAMYAAARLWEEAGGAGWPAEAVDRAELASVQALHLAKGVAIDVTTRGFDVCGARAAFNAFPLGQMLRDVRTFTLHFRDEAYMKRVADAVLGEGFSAKGYAGGSTPPEHEPIQQA